MYWDQEKRDSDETCRRDAEAWEKEGDHGGVGIEGGAVFCAEFTFFAAHDEGIDQGEIEEQQGGDNPGMHGDGSAEGEETTAEVQRIAGAGVGAGDGEDFLLVEITGGVGANDEAEEADGGTEKNGVERGRARKSTTMARR